MIPIKEPQDRQDDFQIWPVWWHGCLMIHAVRGGHSRVTICGRDFISRDYMASPPRVTCERCILLLGGTG